MKSGYSTSILVHKEGFMTNEELSKEIFKQTQKPENRFQMIMIGLLFLEVFGLCLVCYPMKYISGDATFMMGFLIGIAFFVFFWIWYSKTNKHNKAMRDYVWNLVRADERNRLQVSKR